MTPIEEVREILASIEGRIVSGMKYCADNPESTVGRRLLSELEYRRVWTKRFLSMLDKLQHPETLSDVVYIVSPLARFAHILAVMLGSRSGIEGDNFVAQLAEYMSVSEEIQFLEETLKQFDEGFSMTPDELCSVIESFAIVGFRAWLGFREKITLQ